MKAPSILPSTLERAERVAGDGLHVVWRRRTQ